MRRAVSQDGFTLVELLVAMLLLSFIGLAIAGGLQFGTRVWERSEQGIAGTETTETAQAILREVLSSALPHQAGGFARFTGEPDEAAFDGPAPRALERGGLAHFVVTAKDGRLVLRVTALDGADEGREAVLGNGAMRLAYLDASEKTPVWLDYWRDRDRLPDAVRITGDGEDWPQLIVHPAIAQDADCQYDPVSVSCRNK